jgi:hypothetical protein
MPPDLQRMQLSPPNVININVLSPIGRQTDTVAFVTDK